MGTGHKRSPSGQWQAEPHILYPWAPGGEANYGCRSQWHPDNIDKVHQGYEQEDPKDGNGRTNQKGAAGNANTDIENPLRFDTTADGTVLVSLDPNMDSATFDEPHCKNQTEKQRTRNKPRKTWWERLFGVPKEKRVREVVEREAGEDKDRRRQDGQEEEPNHEVPT